MQSMHPQLLCQPSSALTDTVSDHSASIGNLTSPRIFVDADSCPVLCKEILITTAMRRKIHLLLVANRFLRVPPSPYIHNLIAPSHPQATDVMICRNVLCGDVVITDDRALIGDVVSKKAYAIDSRGKTFTLENLNFSSQWRIPNMNDLYKNGLLDGKSTYSKQDKMTFANALDRLLTKVFRNRI